MGVGDGEAAGAHGGAAAAEAANATPASRALRPRAGSTTHEQAGAGATRTTCPACGISVTVALVNQHLDTCLAPKVRSSGGGSGRSKGRGLVRRPRVSSAGRDGAEAAPAKRMSKMCYNVLETKRLRQVRSNADPRPPRARPFSWRSSTGFHARANRSGWIATVNPGTKRHKLVAFGQCHKSCAVSY